MTTLEGQGKYEGEPHKEGWTAMSPHTPDEEICRQWEVEHTSAQVRYSVMEEDDILSAREERKAPLMYEYTPFFSLYFFGSFKNLTYALYCGYNQGSLPTSINIFFLLIRSSRFIFCDVYSILWVSIL